MHRASSIAAGVTVLLVMAVLLAAPAHAGGWRVHAGGWWGGGWNGHWQPYRRHGAYAWGRGGNFAFGLGLAFPFYSGGGYDYAPRYYAGSRAAVIYRPAPVVVQSRPVTAVRSAPVRTTSVVPPGCREFHTEVTIAGRLQPAWGIACPQADGSWRIVE